MNSFFAAMLAVLLCVGVGEIATSSYTSLFGRADTAAPAGSVNPEEVPSQDRTVARAVDAAALDAGRGGYPQAAEQASNASAMKRANKVEPLEVRIQPGDKAKVVAILTYDDGTKAKCEYVVAFNVAKQSDGVALTMAPLPRTERCSPVK